MAEFDIEPVWDLVQSLLTKGEPNEIQLAQIGALLAIAGRVGDVEKQLYNIDCKLNGISKELHYKGK